MWKSIGILLPATVCHFHEKNKTAELEAVFSLLFLVFEHVHTSL